MRVERAAAHWLISHAVDGLFARAHVARPGAPSAELREIPPKRQAAVTTELRRSISAGLEGKVLPGRAQAVNELLAHVGDGDFYDVLARHDPTFAAKWAEMGQVQRAFAAAEPTFDAKTRAYSESMRATLHAAVLQHVASDPPGGKSLYERFIELHPTAFHQNGGWVDNLQIPPSGALAVLKATPKAMWKNWVDLAEGALRTDTATVTAAEWVRSARRTALAAGWG